MNGYNFVFLLVILGKVLLATEENEIKQCLNVENQSKESCNSAFTSDSGYKCCFVEKTEREGNQNIIKSCARIFNDESSLNIYKRRYNDDYKSIDIQCSSGYLMLSLFILIALFF